MELRSTVFVLTALAALAANGPAQSADKTLDRSFQAQSGDRLSVDLDVGSIVVTGADADRVVVRLRAQGDDRELERLEWSAERDDKGVVVKTKRGSRSLLPWFWNDLKVNAEIEVPRRYEVDLVTSGGNIQLRHLEGDATGRTSGGRVDVDSVRGNVLMRTSGGRVTAAHIDGQVQLHTSGGSIQVSQIDGSLRAHTSGGSIRVERASGPIEVHTSGGSIDIDLIGDNEGVSARTSGGSITLRLPNAVRATLNASTSGGHVKSELPVTTNESSKNALHGAINGGGPEILARSSGGSIQVVRRD